jgi:hypothetical protein
MSKITYQQKIELLERYKARPMGISDIEVFTAIKADVVRVNAGLVPRQSKAKEAEKGTDQVAEQPQHALYNSAMGLYRNFLKKRDSHLDMTGVKAKRNAEAMRNILEFIRRFARSNGKADSDEHVLKGLQFMFDNWDRLNDFHRNRLSLPDIHSKIEEILPMIKNGYDKRTGTKSEINNLEASIIARRQGNGAKEG